MTSHTLPSFWEAHYRLPDHVRQAARKAFFLWKESPVHPSLHFKRVNQEECAWSVRITLGYRALGVTDGDTVTWFWIGREWPDVLLARGTRTIRMCSFDARSERQSGHSLKCGGGGKVWIWAEGLKCSRNARSQKMWLKGVRSFPCPGARALRRVSLDGRSQKLLTPLLGWALMGKE